MFHTEIDDIGNRLISLLLVMNLIVVEELQLGH